MAHDSLRRLKRPVQFPAAWVPFAGKGGAYPLAELDAVGAEVNAEESTAVRVRTVVVEGSGTEEAEIETEEDGDEEEVDVD